MDDKKLLILRVQVMYLKFRLAVCRLRRKCLKAEFYVVDKIFDFNNGLIKLIEKA